MGTDDDAVELVLEPSHATMDADDDRFARHVDDLKIALKEEVGGLRADSTPTAGARGGFEEILLALGSSGAITAAVAVFKAWLARDKARKVTIKIKDKRKTGRDVEITVDSASADQILGFIDAAKRA
jgi:Effector Associated Constant Component 1